jgi:hypothetical protein
MLSDHQLEELSRQWKRVPLPVLASQFGLDLLDMLAQMRAARIVEEVQPQELQFIQTNLDRIPPEELRRRLHLSRTQFSQICEMLGRTARRSGTALTLDEARRKTQWLIEEKLQWPMDDFLPRKISKAEFLESELHHCIRYAERAKAQDPLYRHFPSVAFLVCNTYDFYRPFQFRHAKQNGYFRGTQGRRNLLKAVQWVIEHKLGMKPEYVPVLAERKYFLRSADLQFYGLGPHCYRQHFGSKAELVSAVLKLYVPGAVVREGGSSTRLRQTLAQAGRPVTKCEVPGCDYDDEAALDVHHVIGRASPMARFIVLHGPDNLVALCPNHHRAAHAFSTADLNLQQPSAWWTQLLQFLTKSED